MSRVLLLEDDASIVNGLSIALKRSGYTLTAARTVKQAEAIWEDGKNEGQFDLLLLDVTLPDGSGFNFCKGVREVSNIPVIFLTASDEEASVIRGLDLGADDYITKPFKLAVLLSRMKALLRRAGGFGTVGNPEAAELNSNGIKLLRLKNKAYKNGKLLDLTLAEYKLLCLFMQNPGATLSKETILKDMWNCDVGYADGNTLSVYIRRLRTKVEDDPGDPRMVVTVRGIGYKWNVIS